MKKKIIGRAFVVLIVNPVLLVLDIGIALGGIVEWKAARKQSNDFAEKAWKEFAK